MTPLVAALLPACLATPVAPNSTAEPLPSEHRVVPIVFVPTDYSHLLEGGSVVEFFQTKVHEARLFFGIHNSGKTFRALPVDVVHARHDHSWYWRENSRNFEHNVLAELQERGYPVHIDWNRFPGNRVVWVLAMGGGGWAGGRHYPTGGGFAMWGDALLYAGMDLDCNRVTPVDTVDPIKGTCQESWLPSGKIYGFGVGAAVHELGHAFDLPHPPDGSPDWETTVMGCHWNYPHTGLSGRDKAILASSPFFE